MIALSDKLSNMRSIYLDYQAIGDELWEQFHEKRKEEHGWYYQSLVAVFEDLNQFGAYQEYVKLVEMVFGAVLCKE